MIAWNKDPFSSGKVRGTAVFHYLVETEDGRDVRHGFLEFAREDDFCVISIGMGPHLRPLQNAVTGPFTEIDLLQAGLNLVRGSCASTIREVWI